MRTGAVPHKRTWAKAAVLGTVAALVLFITMLVAPLTPPSAQATVPGVDPNTLSWDTTNRSYYGNYNTPIFTSTNADGQTTFSYCVDPTTTVPNAGSYQTMAVGDFNPTMARETRAAMWFGYGGPGFDPSMWPSVWNDGSPMQPANYYAATHIILSYTTMQDLRYAYYNAGSDFISYAASTFMGYNPYGRVTNPNSTLFQMFSRADEVPDDYMCYYLDCGERDWVQYIIAQDPYVPLGNLTVRKTSSNPILTLENPCYSLEGASFGIYADAACEQLATTVVTDASGSATAQGLRAGTYWVKELEAPRGYAIDGEPRAVQVPSGQTAVVEVADVPQADPLPLVVRKVDASDPGRGLEGAEFTLRYYAGFYDAELPSTPTRSWVLRTDGNGEAQLGDGWLIAGDELYRDGSGTPVLPLGTVSIQETRAPAGYQIDDGEPHVQRIDGSGDAPTVSRYVAPTIQDTPTLGGISIQKADADTGSTMPQGGASLQGAEFSIVTLGPVAINGTPYEAGGTVATLVTDGRGFATTSPTALPCGSYRVEETRAPAGYLPSPETWTVHLDKPGEVVAVGGTPQRPLYESTPVSLDENPALPSLGLETQMIGAEPLLAGLLLLENSLPLGPTAAYAQETGVPAIPEQVIRGGLRVQKIDAGLEAAQPQGSATLAGARFSIVNASERSVFVNGKAYAPGEEVLVITTGDDGVAQTGERDLPFGRYAVTEIEAPTGYHLSDPEAKTVEIREDGRIYDAPSSFSDQVLRGGIALEKLDADTGRPEPQGAASLSGARFAISNAGDGPVVVDGQAFSPGEVVMTIATDERGKASTGDRDLPYGTYLVQEVQAPDGYLVNETIWEVRIQTDGELVLVGEAAEREREEQPVGFFEGIASILSPTPAEAQEDSSGQGRASGGEVVAEQVIRGGVEIFKRDAETVDGSPQGDTSLAGARFAVTTLNDGDVVVGGTVYQKGETVMVLETDERGRAASGEWDLPYGDYAVEEIEPPAGYLAPVASQAQTFSVTVDGLLASLESGFANNPARGGVGVQKVDAETSSPTPLGSARLDGAVFSVSNASRHAVVYEGTSYEPGEAVMVIRGNAEGSATTDAHALPIGTYAITEIEAPEGYVLEPSITRYVSVLENGVVFAPTDPLPNRVVRGDIEGIKVEDGTQRRMAGVAFLVTSLTTGEHHVIVSDENGLLATSAEVVPHSHNTNANDGALDDDGHVIDESALSPSNGLWFSGSSTVSTEPNDEVGALPFDRYRFDELPTSANYGHELVAFEVSVRRDGQVVDIGTINNDMIALKTTVHAGAPGLNEAPAAQGVVITDVVSYTNLSPGTSYELRGTLVDRATGNPLLDESGNELTSSCRFVPEERSGAAEVSFELDATGLEGKRVVVFERLYLDGIEIAAHDDIADDAQTVSFVGIATSATGAISGLHEEQASPKTGIVDTVSYLGLTPGQEYRLEATVVDKATGASLVGPDGTPATAVHRFVAQGSSGTESLKLEIDAADLSGHRVVVFERLYKEGHEIASHCDLESEDQTVRLISLKTTAVDKESGSHAGNASSESTIVDTVAYQGLEPGAEYQLVGVLMDRNSREPLTGRDGRGISVTRALVPLEAEGSAVMEFDLDSSSLTGPTVVFEVLLRGDSIVAIHADIDDEEQTVHWTPVLPIPRSGDSTIREGNLLMAVGGAACLMAASTIALCALRLQTKGPRRP